MVDKWFRGWTATRGDRTPSTPELYSRLLERWIDAKVTVVGGARPRVVRLGAMSLASVTPAVVREWDAAVLAEASRRAAERWSRAASAPKRVNAAIRAWAAENGRTVAATGRTPVELREAWLEATGGVVADAREGRRNLGRTEAARAYRLLHTGMVQAVSDGLIPANPCAIKGASQRDSRHRTERRVLAPDELWARAEATLVALTGATLPELMQRAGHSTPRAALHYQHAANDAQQRIAAHLDTAVASLRQARRRRDTQVGPTFAPHD